MTFPTSAPSVPIGPVVKTVHIGSDQAIDCGDYVLVASSSEPDSWHVVTTAPPSCTCASFLHRSVCRHLTIAMEAQMRGIEDAIPVESRVPTGPAVLAFMQLADD